MNCYTVIKGRNRNKEQGAMMNPKLPSLFRIPPLNLNRTACPFDSERLAVRNNQVVPFSQRCQDQHKGQQARRIRFGAIERRARPLQ
jgi:hypothetical protein